MKKVEICFESSESSNCIRNVWY